MLRVGLELNLLHTCVGSRSACCVIRGAVQNAAKNTIPLISVGHNQSKTQNSNFKQSPGRNIARKVLS